MTTVDLVYRKAAALTEDLALPITGETEAIRWMTDVLHQAIAERKGIAVIGPRGAGKTVALASAIEEVRKIEQAAADEEQRAERRLLEVQSPRAEVRRHVIGAIWQEVFGMEQPQRVRNRRLKPDDVLLEELVEMLIQQNVVALAFDEAECLSSEGITVIRDIISRAERLGRERRYNEGKYRPFGIGVVLVGTEELHAALMDSGELGQRWVRIVEVGLLEPDQVARTYQKFLPAFKDHVNRIGNDAWNEFVRVRVCNGSAMPIRLLENHVRAYARRMVADNPDITSISDVKFDEELFFMTLNEIPGARGTA